MGDRELAAPAVSQLLRASGLVMARPVSTLTARRQQGLARPGRFPGWLVSLVLHTATLIILGVWVQHLESSPAGWRDGPPGEIGVVLESEGFDPTSMSSGPESNSSQESTQSQDNEGTVQETEQITVVPEPTTVPPIDSDLTGLTGDLSTPMPTVGPAVLFPSGSGTDPRDRIQTGGAQSAGGALSGGMPGAAFMGARDQGTRIVFVIDCSASMANYGAMSSAKAALVSSLQALTETQQFQVLFYNQHPRPLSIRGNTDVVFATEVNKTLARQQISGVQPDLGTEHVPALKMALRMTPDVLFFLTDADEPQMTSEQLNDIQKTNRGRTRIHTIEFGTESEIDVDNFLKKLARQNGGTYRYVSLKRFSDASALNR